MKRFSHYQRTPAMAVGSPRRRRGRRGTRRLRGGALVLAVGLVALLMFAGTASATDPPPHFVVTQDDVTGHLDFAPCQPGQGLDFTFTSPVGGFPAHFCKQAALVDSQVLGTFALQVNTFPFNGIVNVTGTVKSLTVIDNNPAPNQNTAWECDLIKTSNSPLIPAGDGLRVQLVDGNWQPIWSTEPIAPPYKGDRIAAFVTPPPGPNPTCPNFPLPTQSVNSGGVIVQ